MPRPFPNYESYTHPDNGMTLFDMLGALDCARHRNELILFRSTGPWSRRWIERGHPTKPFHVKGKSSDWGPQAGFVPWKGMYSKVGYDAEKAASGDKLNAEGIRDGFAKRVPLMLSKDDLQRQLSMTEKGRTAIKKSAPSAVLTRWTEDRQNPASIRGVQNEDLFLWAEREGKVQTSTQMFAFWARWNDPFWGGAAGMKDKYTIYAFPELDPQNKSTVVGQLPPEGLAKLVPWAELLEVMGTAEQSHDGKGTDLPLTGDYDLFAVGPHFNDYSPSSKDKRHKYDLDNKAWEARLDKYLNKVANNPGVYKNLEAAFWDWLKTDAASKEDPDKGNVTPRLLTVIDQLNVFQALAKELYGKAHAQSNEATWLSFFENPTATKIPLIPMKQQQDLLREHELFRRVHHNEEAGRPFLSNKDMTAAGGDKVIEEALPVTAFHPQRLGGEFNAWIVTLTSADEVRRYWKAAYRAGYVLPKNPKWVMDSAIAGESEVEDDDAGRSTAGSNLANLQPLKHDLFEGSPFKQPRILDDPAHLSPKTKSKIGVLGGSK